MDDSLAVASHADAVNVMHLRRCIADRAATVLQAEVKILADIVRARQQALFGWYAKREAEVYQVVDKLACGAHVHVRQAEHLQLGLRAEIPCEHPTQVFGFMSRPERDVADNGKYLFALLDANRASVVDA